MAHSSDEDRSTTQPTELTRSAAGVDLDSPCIVVIHGEGLGQRLRIGREALIIGRGSEAQLRIEHASVSRRHCVIAADPITGRYRVRDLESKNRTLVNEQPVTETDLADGDLITVGKSVLKFISRHSIELQYEEALYQLATHDALTGLFNRRHFLELLDAEIARSEQRGVALSLAIVDVDWFKQINDTYGHAGGDEVLRGLAELLQPPPGGSEAVARIGGEEFAMFLTDMDLAGATAYVDRLRQRIASTRLRCGEGREPLTVTVSAGVAALKPAAASITSLLRAADAALYRAKQSGRNRVLAADEE